VRLAAGLGDRMFRYAAGGSETSSLDSTLDEMVEAQRQHAEARA